MGKLKDAAPTKSSSGGSAKKGSGAFRLFFANLLRVERYKPLQGRRARLGTTIGLVAVVGLGLVQLYFTLDEATQLTRIAVPLVAGAILGWLIYRVLEFPPFVEFLIATEAEMNKVSWTSRDDLKRATTVVLVTVALMAVFLFGVDWLWSNMLQWIGVLRFRDTGSALGSSA
jgi:preprotein translocase subunit SecE